MKQILWFPLSESVTVTPGGSAVAGMWGRHEKSGAPDFLSWHTRLKWNKVCFPNFREGFKVRQELRMRREGMRTLMRPETQVVFHVKCSLEVFELNENLNLSAVFRTILQCKIS